MVEDTRHLPETLAENGSVHIGRHEIAQLMGQVGALLGDGLGMITSFDLGLLGLVSTLCPLHVICFGPMGMGAGLA